MRRARFGRNWLLLLAATAFLAVGCAEDTGKASLDTDLSSDSDRPDSMEPSDTDPTADSDPSDTDLPGDTGELSGSVDTASPADTHTSPTDTGVAAGYDRDHDGFTAEDGDCDDTDPTIHPGATDAACDGVDRDCDGFDHVGRYQHWVYDWLDDGTPDAEQRIFDSRSRFWAIYDEGRDGVFEQVAEGQYDANGLLIEYTVDLLDDGIIDYVFQQDRDASGTLLAQREDLENDGVWDNERYYVYDALGHLIEVEIYAGGVSYTLTFTHDARGRAQTVVYDDGSLVMHGAYTWAGDQVTRFAWELTGMGVVFEETWTYDAQGRELTYELDDFVADGIVDYREVRTWHPNGALASLAVDSDGDGTPETVETHHVAADGSLVEWTADAPYDGTVDHRATITDQCTDALLTLGASP